MSSKLERSTYPDDFVGIQLQPDLWYLCFMWMSIGLMHSFDKTGANAPCREEDSKPSCYFHVTANNRKCFVIRSIFIHIKLIGVLVLSNMLKVYAGVSGFILCFPNEL